MDIAEQQRILADFLNTQCNARYSPESESVRFIAKPGPASMRFPEMQRLAASIGVATSGRDLTFFGDRKLQRLEAMGVTIDRTPAGQQAEILGR